jgi:hypothetical protein
VQKTDSSLVQTPEGEVDMADKFPTISNNFLGMAQRLGILVVGKLSHESHQPRPPVRLPDLSMAFTGKAIS